MRTVRLFIILLLAGSALLPATAQSQDRKKIRQQLRTGNRQFRSGHRDKATTSYQKALSLDSTHAKALYNMGTSLLPEEFWRPWPQRNDTLLNKEVSRIDSLFQTAADREANPLHKSKSFYNLGVMHQSLYQSNGKDERHLEMAIEAYKNALRNNPLDEDARYNLVVCQRQLKKKQKQQDNQQQQQNDSTQNQQQQQKDSTQNQQQQPPKEQQQPSQQPQQQQQQMDQQRMDQMLQNAMQKERETQRRMNEAQREGQRNRRSNQKNW